MLGSNLAGGLASVSILVANNVRFGRDKRFIIEHKTARLVVSLAALTGGVFFGYKTVKDIAQLAESGKFKGEEVPEVDPITGDETGANTDLKLVAAQIRDAFYNNDWFRLTEDEEAAANALLSIPISDAKRLGQIYFNLYKDVLKAEFVKYFDEGDFEDFPTVKEYLKAM
jgi:hypothetical protein